jgi:hypothetical protein
MPAFSHTSELRSPPVVSNSILFGGMPPYFSLLSLNVQFAPFFFFSSRRSERTRPRSQRYSGSTQACLCAGSTPQCKPTRNKKRKEGNTKRKEGNKREKKEIKEKRRK